MNKASLLSLSEKEFLKSVKAKDVTLCIDFEKGLESRDVLIRRLLKRYSTGDVYVFMRICEIVQYWFENEKYIPLDLVKIIHAHCKLEFRFDMYCKTNESITYNDTFTKMCVNKQTSAWTMSASRIGIDCNEKTMSETVSFCVSFHATDARPMSSIGIVSNPEACLQFKMDPLSKECGHSFFSFTDGDVRYYRNGKRELKAIARFSSGRWKSGNRIRLSVSRMSGSELRGANAKDVKGARTEECKNRIKVTFAVIRSGTSQKGTNEKSYYIHAPDTMYAGIGTYGDKGNIFEFVHE